MTKFKHQVLNTCVAFEHIVLSVIKATCDTFEHIVLLSVIDASHWLLVQILNTCVAFEHIVYYLLLSLLDMDSWFTL